MTGIRRPAMSALRNHEPFTHPHWCSKHRCWWSLSTRSGMSCCWKCETESRAAASVGGPDDDPAWDLRHQQERAAAWEAGATPPPSDPATDGLPSPLRTPEQMTWIHDRFKVDGLERLARADRDYADSHGYYLPDVAALAHAALAALARLRARDQARTDALIEAAWSYRQKADEWDAMAPGRSRTTAAAMALAAADTLTRIAHGDTT